MSESREHKRRYNQRLEYIATFGKWLEAEPPMLLILSWHMWKKSRPRNTENGNQRSEET